MGEPTIPEAAVEALRRYEFMARDCGDRKVLKLTAEQAADAALVAAEPLLHERCDAGAVWQEMNEAVNEEHDRAEALQAEVARLREALIRAREDMEGWAAYAEEYFIEKHDLAGDLAAIDAALAPSDEEPGT